MRLYSSYFLITHLIKINTFKQKVFNTLDLLKLLMNLLQQIN